ncbi:hypothetical protein NT6N_01430 [Oceaniferula spumae]|uniref:Uncharacterized protein n=1 Tax=Oceaniferula spumae TaxID=2979115 RepID=A0AAT9FGL4_9BACT
MLGLKVRRFMGSNSHNHYFENDKSDTYINGL